MEFWNKTIGEAYSGQATMLGDMNRAKNPFVGDYQGLPTRHNQVYVDFSKEASVDPIHDKTWRREAIAYRLRVGSGSIPFDDLETALGTDSVYIMIVVGGKGVMLEDERGLFPSDTLVTQLRLISK